MTILSIIKHPSFIFRMFDFPRLQKFHLNTAILIIYSLAFDWDTAYEIIFLVLFLWNEGYLLYVIYPYTPLASPNLKRVEDQPNVVNTLSLLISNVRQKNNQYDKVGRLITQTDADLVLLVETNEWWRKRLQPYIKDYPYKKEHPLENTYGMLLYSKLPLEGTRVKHLVEEGVPSIFTSIQLKNQEKVNLYFLHPKPPIPGHAMDSEERDEEIMHIVKEVQLSKNPVIVGGDLNDVAWSHSTRNFIDQSGLGDPRLGRGFYNTFNAEMAFFRWPLDHIFVSKDFELVKLKRLGYVGSDHFPIYCRLSLNGKSKDSEGISPNGLEVL